MLCMLAHNSWLFWYVSISFFFFYHHLWLKKPTSPQTGYWGKQKSNGPEQNNGCLCGVVESFICLKPEHLPLVSHPPTVTDGATTPRRDLHYSMTSLCQARLLMAALLSFITAMVLEMWVIGWRCQHIYAGGTTLLSMKLQQLRSAFFIF